MSKEIEIPPGENIHDAVLVLFKTVQHTREPHHIVFNGCTITATGDESFTDLMRQYAIYCRDNETRQTKKKAAEVIDRLSNFHPDFGFDTKEPSLREIVTSYYKYSGFFNPTEVTGLVEKYFQHLAVSAEES